MKYIFKNNWRSMIFIIIVLLTILIMAHKDIFHRVNAEFSFEILIASITAIFTAIAFNLYESFKDYISLKELTGYWMVLKFDTESYLPQNSYVKIDMPKNNILTYHNINLENLDTIEGEIYMNLQNRYRGNLILRHGWLNNISTLYPASEHSIYIDLNLSNELVSQKFIRILDLAGNEVMILQKPINQKIFIQNVNQLYKDSAECMSSTISNPFFGT